MSEQTTAEGRVTINLIAGDVEIVRWDNGMVAMRWYNEHVETWHPLSDQERQALRQILEG